jgi:hypothetical protein
LLLKHLRSPARALAYLTRLHLNTVPGIADGIRKGVRRDLGLADDELLMVVNGATYEFCKLDEE